MSITAAELDAQLSRIFEVAHHWKALLLLDEADVYVEQRSSQDLTRNGLVSIFLRKLEYCEGIIFLTTNRVTDFDVAILSRIHLLFKYDDLSKEAGQKVWEQFLNRPRKFGGPTKITPKELEWLVNGKLNGRQASWLLVSHTSLANSQPQIKNVMATALAIAKKRKSPLRYCHLRMAANACKKSIEEFNGRVDLNSYN